MAKEDDELQQDQQQSPEPPAPDRIVINPNDDEDDDDGEAQAQSAQPGAKPGRRNGYRALKDSLKAEKERNDRLEREFAELRGRSSAQPAPIIIRDNQQQAADPHEAELEVIESQKAGLLASIRAATDPAEVARLSKQWNTADRKRIKLEVAAANKAERAAQPQEDIDARIGQQTMRQNFPRLFTANGPSSYGIEAQAETMRIIESGRANGRSPIDIANEAAATVYARHGLGPQKRAAPSDTERARYVSAPARAATTASKEGWSPNKQQLKLAMAYTEHRSGLTDEQRVHAWYKEVGKKHGIV